MASNEVKITVTAKDQASSKLKSLTNVLDSVSNKVLGLNLTDLVNPATLAAGALGAVAATIKGSISDFAAYGKQVEGVSRKLGISAEESSKLIQVSDDLEVEFSTLEAAFKAGLKNGVIPSIEGIADLATEYQAIEDPVKRAAFATDKFGKAGLEMQKMLEVAPEQLRAMGAEVESTGLLMTKEGVEAAKKYRVQLDQLSDSWTGIKNQIGMAVVPALGDYLQLENAVFAALRDGRINIIEADKANLDYITGIKDLNTILEELAPAQQEANDMWALANTVVGEQTDEQNMLAIALAGTAAAQQTVNDKVLTASDVMKDYTAQLLFNLAAANLDAEGALQLASAMGLIDNKTVAAYSSVETLTAAFDTNNDGVVTGTENVDAYVTALASLDRKLAEMPDDKTIDVYLNIHGDLAGIERVMNTAPGKGAGSGPIMDAVGGPMYRGETHIAGEAGYPETIVQGANGGWVYPSAPTNNYNLTINSQARSEQVAASFALMQAMAR